VGDGVELAAPWLAYHFAYIGGLLGTVFWVWMIVDCAQNEPDRHIWLWIIFLLHLPGALIYFFVRRTTRLKLPTPKFAARWFRRNELWDAQEAANHIGNAHQFVLLGELCLELGLWDEALGAFDRALEKEQGNLQALWGAARAARSCQDDSRTRAFLETILAANPKYKYGAPFLLLGTVLLDMGDAVAAKRLLEEGKDQWDTPETHVLLGRALIELDEIDEARQVLENVAYHMRATPSFDYRKNSRWIRKASRLLRTF